MYFHTHEYIYLTYFNDEIIALDLQKDQYVFLSQFSEIIYFALNNEFKYVQEKYAFVENSDDHTPDDFNKAIKYLREIGILSSIDYNYSSPIKLTKAKFSAGAPNVDWRMSISDLNNKVKISMIFEAYLLLIKVYFIINVFGFYGLIKAIKQKKVGCVRRDANEFDVLAAALNQACFYFPIKTKCLEWSATLTFMGLRRKWKCNLEIGVQNLPFAAHAWVKVDDKVIADIQNLPETLSVILSEPFSIRSN
jgi:hypothetical protein